MELTEKTFVARLEKLQAIARVDPRSDPEEAQRFAETDTEFQDPMELIKIALNKQRLFNKERYAFGPVKA